MTLKEVYKESFPEIESVFKDKSDYNGKTDHGIVSGYIFYDALVKNYLEKLENHLRKNPNAKKTDEFNSDKNRTYRPEHLVLFKIIANAIICHNIWRYEKETKLALTIKEDFAADCETVKKWFEKIESMKKWMKINVERCADGKSIEISLGKKTGMKKRKSKALGIL